MRLPVLILFLGLLGCTNTPASSFKIDGGRSSFTIPFRLVDNRVFIEAKVNGQGPFHFILDTGASGTMMRPAAARLGLKITNESEQSGVGEKRVASGETEVHELQVGDAHFFDLDVGVLPGDDTPEVF